MSDELRIGIHGQFFRLNAHRAAFWEEERALLCSDLHWGREAYLQSRGFPVPEAVFTVETVLLSALLERYRARRLYFLGDLIHHSAGMHGALRGKIRAWREGHPEVDMGLIPGNHDRRTSEWLPECAIDLLPPEVVHAGIRLRHEPEEKTGGGKFDGKFTWYGHLHPAVRVPEITEKKLPAFFIGKDAGFLPAFSRLAGGAEITSRRPEDEIFPMIEDVIFKWERGTTKGRRG